MPDKNQEPFDKDAILALFKKAKSTGNAYTFAFGLASKPKECGFLPHLRKPGKALKTDLKATSKALKKVCFGTFTINGNDVLLTSARPLKGIVRQLRVKFRDEKMGKFKPILVDENGNEIDEETLPDPDSYDDDDDDDAVQAPDLSQALTRRLAEVRESLKNSAPQVAQQLKPDFVAAVQLVQSGELQEAEGAISQLEAALSQGSGTQTQGKAQKVTAIFRSAKETVDQDVGKLAKALQGQNEPALQRIAEHGLTALKDGKTYVNLLAALMEFDKAQGPAVQEAARVLIPRVEAYKNAVMTDDMVGHWEKNPLVPLSIRTPMGQALDEIAQTARAALTAP